MSYLRKAWSVMLVVLTLLVEPPFVSSAQGPDDLWEITTKVEMAGMPMAIPPQTSQVCVRKGGRDEELVPRDNKECKVLEFRQSGNKTTFRIICEGENKMTGTGEFEHAGNSYRGTMRMQGAVDGRPMNMTQTFSGKRVGACTFQDPGQQTKDMAAEAVAEACRDALNELNSYMFTMEQSPCKHMRPEFCGRVGKLAQEMREPAGFRTHSAKRSNWRELLSGCGQDPEAVAKAACGRSVQNRDWNFVAEYCEADATRLVAQQCEGRDYTAAMSSEYAPICRRFLARDASRPPSKGARSDVTQPAREAQQPGVLDQLKEGAGKLKGLFKY